MPDVNKNINLNMHVTGVSDVERLERALASAIKAYETLSSKKNVDVYKQGKAQENIDRLQKELEAAKALAAAYEKIGRGESLSYGEMRTVKADIRRQYSAAKEASEADARIKAFQRDATYAQRYNDAREAILAAGYGEKDTDKFLASHFDKEGDSVGSRISKAWSVLKVAFATAIKIARAINDEFRDILNISFDVRENFKDVQRRVNEITDMRSGAATFATGSSLITNRSARNLQLRYGLTAGESYALSQAGGMLGMDVTSLEDFAYMNESQRELLTQYLERYSKWFDETDRSGVLRDVQEMQVEFAAFKQELSMEWISWLAKNKDTILAAADGILQITEFLLNIRTGIKQGFMGAFSWLFQDLGTGPEAASAADVLASNAPGNITITVNSENNVTGTITDQQALERQLDDWGAKVAGEIVAGVG